jgi:hypothetical protein
MRAIATLWLVLLAAGARAEVVTWQANKVIDVPVEVSLPHQDHRPRLIYFPSKTVEVSAEIDDSDMTIKNEGNAIRVALINPEFRTHLFVIGSSADDGSVYALVIHPVAAGQTVDPVLQIVAEASEDAAQPEPNRQAASTDFDGEAIALMRHMMGGERRPEVAESADGVMTDKGFQVGRRLYDSDNLTITCTKIYRSVNVCGYQCILHYRGREPRRVNYQRLFFDDAICVSASKQTVMDSMNPGTDVAPGERIVLWFVARAAQR